MAKTLIALYGSTHLSRPNIAFVEDLATAFLEDPDVVLVTGGIHHLTTDPSAKSTSVDLATLRAAEAYAKQRRVDLAERLETWLPEQRRAGVIRFRHGVVKKLKGSPLARRFKLVSDVDAIVTISGEGNTGTVIELAVALNRLVLPIGFSGRDSKAAWTSDRETFAERFELTPSLVRRLGRQPGSRHSKALAKDVAAAVLAKAHRRCLVLMDFGGRHDAFYNRVLEPAIAAAGFRPHRLDRDEGGGTISDLFRARLADSHAIVVDVTGLNPNVMYELGHVHQRSMVTPLIVTRDQISVEHLPFYLRPLLLLHIGRNEREMRRRIGQHLRLIRGAGER